jgi:hypothetical protein
VMTSSSQDVTVEVRAPQSGHESTECSFIRSSGRRGEDGQCALDGTFRGEDSLPIMSGKSSPIRRRPLALQSWSHEGHQIISSR